MLSRARDDIRRSNLGRGCAIRPRIGAALNDSWIGSGSVVPVASVSLRAGRVVAHDREGCLKTPGVPETTAAKAILFTSRIQARLINND